MAQSPAPPGNKAGKKQSALGAWQSHHARCLRDSFWRLIRRPLGTWATIFAIAVVLALPGFLMTLASQMKTFGGVFAAEQGQMNIYLKTGMPPAAVVEFTEWLKQFPQIEHSEVITPEQGLKQLAHRLNISQLESGSDNPLPPVVIVRARAGNPQDLLDLQTQIQRNPRVDSIATGGQWIERLQKIANFFNELSGWLLALFGLTVLFVVGNTLRLELEGRRQELLLMALIGATRRYMLRPLLYDGAVMGLLGGLIAGGLINILLSMLTTPINEIAREYGATLTLLTPASLVLTLGLTGALLGWLSAQIIGQNFLRSTVQV
ncbi:cell division protein FtsX [Halothiobacillus sp. DCM-1]|uniref:cell division protein FtsX n=1 Tax=Halothiobacillus sp. DCM-1 TaxID=3112558 RepID=UPI003243BC72